MYLNAPNLMHYYFACVMGFILTFISKKVELLLNKKQPF